MKATPQMIRKRVVIVSLVIPIALLHFATGTHYRGPYPGFVNGYLLDILVPFAFYFLLCLSEFSLLRSWIVKSVLVFGAGSSVEIAQFFGVPIFGRTFDPVDFIMYGIGIMLAVVLDTTVFPRIFEFWTPEAGPCSCNTEVRGL
jgi:glycopeptide antibiotics resistance protein